MTPRTPTPTSWNWATGIEGQNRVRVFTHASGRLYVDYFERTPTGRQRRVQSLHHADRAAAKQEAERIARRLTGRDAAELTRPAPTQLGPLFDNYLAKKTQDKAATTQAHDRRAARLFRSYFGDGRAVESLHQGDWDAFITARKSGELAHPGRQGRPCRSRIIEQDLRLLLAVLNWGTRVRDAGRPLLERNPLKGLTVPTEKNVRRPVLYEEEYLRLLTVAPQVSAPFALALVLCHETGHRLKSVRLLRWSDIDLPARTIRWRSEVDKAQREHITRVTNPAADALQRSRTSSTRVGDGWVFLNQSTGEPLRRERFIVWWREAEARSGIAREAGRGWHSLRRQFATELLHQPDRILGALMGSSNPHVIRTAYQHPTGEMLDEAVAQRRTIRRAAS